MNGMSERNGQGSVGKNTDRINNMTAFGAEPRVPELESHSSFKLHWLSTLYSSHKRKNKSLI
jgi:hypothetical protein